MTAVTPEMLDLGEQQSFLDRLTRSFAAVVRLPAIAAAGLAVVSGFLYLWNLTESGFANSYYSAAALAASQSWSAWFFGSLDAGNFITVDKPPLSTMLMGLSVRVFGLSSASILVPEALLGVGSVLLLFAIVRRQFGLAAGVIAGTVMAITPVAALMFRYDHPDALMTFLMLGAAFATQRAIENGRHRWLVVAGIALGLAFLSKYFQGLLVGPGLGLAYIVATNTSLRRRVVGLFVLGATTLVTAGLWVAAVIVTPASARPYIGGSTNNSVLDLIFGYDGLGRIFGASAGGVGQGGANFSGTPGLLRLFDSDFGGQIAWLLPASLILLAAGLFLTRRLARTNVRRAGYLMWGGWLLVTAVVFSFMSGIVHSYYAVALAPAIGALVGGGVVELWRARERFLAAGLVLGAAILASVGLAVVLLLRSPSFASWLPPLICGLGIAATIVVALPATRGVRVGLAGLTLGLVAMLSGPAAFTFNTITTAYSGSIVAAGPDTTATDFLSGSSDSQGRGFALGGFPGNGGPGGNGGPAGFAPGRSVGGPGGSVGTADSSLASYLVTNQGSATWIVAVSGASDAAELELATGKPVMAMGGWSGSDNALTLDELKADVAGGSLRYVIVGGQVGGFGGFNSQSSEVTAWITSHGTLVSVPGSSASVYDLSNSLS
jgi:4-amino-4-deoxy-L-arabinose transferase-like glycosyltransferase